MVKYIELPSTGESAMDGKGRLCLKDQLIVLECRSYWRGLVDYQLQDNGEYKKVYFEQDELADEFTGTFPLFKTIK